MKQLIYLLTALPMLVCAEQTPGLTTDSTSSGRAGATNVESAAPSSSERLSVYQGAGDGRRQFAELIEATIKKHPPKYGERVFAEAVGVALGGDIWSLNSIAWDVFIKCDDKAVLKQPLSWSSLSIELAQPTLDITYPETEANLFYKLGRVDEAIASEQATIAQGIANAKKAGRAKGDFFDAYGATVEKMRKREPTWLAK